MFTILPVKNKSKKATSQWVGPYRVSKLINPNTVEITSLNLLKRFAVNITVLQVYRGSDRGRPHPVEAHHLVPDEQDPEQVPVGVPGPDDDPDNENDDDEDDTSPLVQSHPVPERMVQLVPPLGARPVSPTPPPCVEPGPPEPLDPPELGLPEELPVPPVDDEDEDDETTVEVEPPTQGRPRRATRLPGHFRDFEMGIQAMTQFPLPHGLSSMPPGSTSCVDTGILATISPRCRAQVKVLVPGLRVLNEYISSGKKQPVSLQLLNVTDRTLRFDELELPSIRFLSFSPPGH